MDNIHPSVVRACYNMCLLFKGQLGNELAQEASSKQVSSRYFPCVTLDEVNHLKGLNLSIGYRSSLIIVLEGKAF